MIYMIQHHVKTPDESVAKIERFEAATPEEAISAAKDVAEEYRQRGGCSGTVSVFPLDEDTGINRIAIFFVEGGLRGWLKRLFLGLYQ